MSFREGALRSAAMSPRWSVRSYGVPRDPVDVDETTADEDSARSLVPVELSHMVDQPLDLISETDESLVMSICRGYTSNEV